MYRLLEFTIAIRIGGKHGKLSCSVEIQILSVSGVNCCFLLLQVGCGRSSCVACRWTWTARLRPWRKPWRNPGPARDTCTTAANCTRSTSPDNTLVSDPWIMDWSLFQHGCHKVFYAQKKTRSTLGHEIVTDSGDSKREFSPNFVFI